MTTAAIIPVAECARCQLNAEDGGEVFYHRRKSFKFDVDEAIRIVGDGREPVEVDEECLRKTLLRTEVDENHLPHVNLGRPGIIAHVTYRLEDGQTVVAHVLIDGNHRAARSLKDGVPFRAYLLDEEETKKILLRAPETVSLKKKRRSSR